MNIAWMSILWLIACATRNPQVSVADVEPVQTKLTTRRGHKQIGKFLFFKKMEFFDMKIVLWIQTIINEFNIEWIFLTTWLTTYHNSLPRALYLLEEIFKASLLLIVFTSIKHKKSMNHPTRNRSIKNCIGGKKKKLQTVYPAYNINYFKLL